MSTSRLRFGTGTRHSSHRPRVLLILSVLLAAGCGTTGQAGAAQPAARATIAGSAMRADGGLYSADEALQDALSGPLEYLGTGRWPGTNRMYACAFRNARVLVVNVYCSRTELPAFAVNVYSPTRGRARIYAESKGAISAHLRNDYFTFTAESEPPPNPGARIPPVSLTMSFGELHNYDAQLHAAFLPACYGGTELSKERGGCLGALAPRASEWAASNRAFLTHASDDWYRLVRELRSQAEQYGKERGVRRATKTPHFARIQVSQHCAVDEHEWA